MSVFKTTFTRALTVIPSANCNIPYPNAIVSSLTTGNSTSNLIDGNVDFIALNVKEGDIVYNTTSNSAATVVGVADPTVLNLNADIFSGGENYVIYQASAQTGIGNTGCNLISNTETDVEVITVGGDNVTIKLSQYVNCGLQVIKVISVSGGITKITALW